MRVSEIFASVQGEGPSLGVPAVFLRLAQCNLSCLWCDTKYAWSVGEDVPVDRVVEEIMTLLRTYSKIKLVVITGGEPLLQRDDVRELIVRLKEEIEYVEVEVETNCTIDPSSVLEVVDRLIVSPKLANSGMPEDLRKCSTRFKDLPDSMKSKVYLKFVIEDARDLSEVEEIVRFFGVSSSSVFLMPQASSIEELTERLKVVVDLAMKTGFRVSDRLQVAGGFR
ncbi:MAG: 7-carboxy-7-deazaguanine synthase QueE [Sulfolobales archaeon]